MLITITKKRISQNLQQKRKIKVSYLKPYRKCYNLIISHDLTESFGFDKVCPDLRCTSCDMKVLRYENNRWKSHCDYLFFRNWRTNP